MKVSGPGRPPRYPPRSPRDIPGCFSIPDPPLRTFGGAESMVMKVHGNVRGEIRVNFLAFFVSKLHIFMRGSLTLSRIVRANVRLNIAIPSAFLGTSNWQVF